ncbi:glycosyl transferase, WecB/TagA/CpsF family [Hymenobacter roseosalivarius DSM 11622]|uniref:Glycosyl transferase, WecB/TagA/CpsF family n=1 Tax=Hymenobacter roseosalivarius DSM 11622 TaxID=645990 RepID=A0A1W1V379_9BACT|nr:WecB/TagA/CpsF family glycosyltransferase [Hymenobacter roseosalivarius]SMB87750.1 glycosyl transferase, WecB/TagA/CpsF family [Hymenobacter roseosalivarius DSM 11622]
MEKIKSVKVLDVPLFAGNIQDASSILRNEMRKEARHNYCISATGAHGLVTAHSDPNLKNILSSFYINLPDGMPTVWVGRMKGEKEMQRCYGPDFFAEMMQSTAHTPIRHFFCGGKEGVADELKAACASKFHNYNVVGTFCPPFRELSDQEFRELGEKITSLDINVVWVGISTPKQEKFAYQLARYTNVHFIVTVGAAFDFHIGKVVQAPGFMQKMGLEWFFRLCVEPKRLWKRYLQIVPLFVYYNILNLRHSKIQH